MPPYQNTKYSRNNPSVAYGIWRCGDSSEVMFDRRYRPMWRRAAGGQCETADPGERIAFVGETWFYRDGTPMAERRQIASAALRAWGLA